MTAEGATARSVLFYSAWPLGYHNIEAERKAVRLAEEGYDVVYVTGVGTRNPRLTRLAKLADRVARKLAPSVASAPAAVPGLRTAAVAVMPPRQLAVVRRANERWVERQLRRAVPRWEAAVAWVRWPTQELVAALQQLRPAVLVYESVDANHLSPGIVGRWRTVFEAAERQLVEMADAVVVPGEALAERYRPWGTPVRLLPHGVELGAFRGERSPRPERPVLGFIGTLDYRLDTEAVRFLAAERPHWRIRLIGPVQEGFEPADLAMLANISVEPPVDQAEVPALCASFDVGLLAYRDHPHFRHMAPVKALELLSAGTGVVARWNAALGELGDLVRFASTPEELLAQAEAVLATDSGDEARRRRAEAERHSWDRTLDAMCSLVSEAVAGRV